MKEKSKTNGNGPIQRAASSLKYAKPPAKGLNGKGTCNGKNLAKVRYTPVL